MKAAIFFSFFVSLAPSTVPSYSSGSGDAGRQTGGASRCAPTQLKMLSVLRGGSGIPGDLTGTPGIRTTHRGRGRGRAEDDMGWEAWQGWARPTMQSAEDVASRPAMQTPLTPMSLDDEDVACDATSSATDDFPTDLNAEGEVLESDVLSDDVDVTQELSSIALETGMLARDPRPASPFLARPLSAASENNLKQDDVPREEVEEEEDMPSFSPLKITYTPRSSSPLQAGSTQKLDEIGHDALEAVEEALLERDQNTNIRPLYAPAESQASGFSKDGKEFVEVCLRDVTRRVLKAAGCGTHLQLGQGVHCFDKPLRLRLRSQDKKANAQRALHIEGVYTGEQERGAELTVVQGQWVLEARTSGSLVGMLCIFRHSLSLVTELKHVTGLTKPVQARNSLQPPLAHTLIHRPTTTTSERDTLPPPENLEALMIARGGPWVMVSLSLLAHSGTVMAVCGRGNVSMVVSTFTCL